VINPNPVVAGISPAAGDFGATVPATITGTNLNGASAVSFSGTGVTATIGSGGTSTSVPVSISIAANAAAGLRTVTVTTPQGTSVPFSGFTVGLVPVITSFTPASGGAGTNVTISGNNLGSATEVRFNGTLASGFTLLPANTQLLTNNGFETGSFLNWSTVNNGDGTFYTSAGFATPVTGYPTVGPHTGQIYAVLDSSDIGASALIQSFTVPVNASKVTLSYSMFVNDQDSGPLINPAGLDYMADPNQHARVDLLTQSAAPFSTGAGVLRNFYLGVDPHNNPNPYHNYVFDITDIAMPGGTYQLRFAAVHNQSFLHMGVDDVSVVSQSTGLQVAVPAGATSGFITVTTPAGTATSANIFTVTVPPPAITAITPASGPQRGLVNATITGTNLLGASVIAFTGTGVTATIGSGGTATSLPVSISIDANASLGVRLVSVTATGGTSIQFSGFTVDPVKKRTGQVTSTARLDEQRPKPADKKSGHIQPPEASSFTPSRRRH
jgi:hypothetical protein